MALRLPAPLRPLFPLLKSIYTRVTRLVAPATIALSQPLRTKLPTGVALTIEDAATDGGRFTEVRPAETLHRTMPSGRPPGDRAYADLLVEEVPRVGLLELVEGRVLAPQAGEQRHVAVVTRSGRLVHELSFYFGTTEPREHPVFLHPFSGPPTDLDGIVGVLVSRGDANYYHFLHECVPRLAILEQCLARRPDGPQPDRWYVPLATPFQRELLDLLGVPPQQRIDASAVPHIRCERLVVANPPSNVSRTLPHPPWVAQYLRARLCPPELRRIAGRYLYLTRGQTRNNRRVVNEEEVLAVLQPLGFELVDAGSLSVREQIRIFAEADILVAPHGAALANLPFCSPGATLLELFPADAPVPDYWKMATGVNGLEYQYLCGTGRPVNRHRHYFNVADITVDLSALSTMVDQIRAAHDTRR